MLRNTRTTARAALGVLALVTASACGGELMSLSISSTAFDHGEAIPVRYTCDGADVSPPLSWSGVPDEAASLVLVVDDPDAPDPAAPQRTWVHWVLYDLPPASGGLDAGVESSALPEGTRQGLNDWDRTGWGGPCPPVGRHRYFFKLYALDNELGELPHPTKAAVEAATAGHVIASATLMGTFQRR